MRKIKINEVKKTVKVLSDDNFVESNKVLCKLKDTGNGFIVKFPSWNSTTQDNYICLDYAEAADLLMALSAIKETFTDD